MNIGDKIFLLYTDRESKETSCEGPSTITSFLIDPHNDEGVIIVKDLNGRSKQIDLEGTSSHDIDIHVVY